MNRALTQNLYPMTRTEIREMPALDEAGAFGARHSASKKAVSTTC
jgi:hypothetical protein